jgi:beta-N-acetylhexosaminidase
MFWRAFLISIIIVSSFGVFGFQKTSFIEQEDNLVHEIGKRNWVDSVTNTLTLEEKIGQFFMAAVYTNKDNAHKQEIYSLVKNNKIGGLIFFKGHPTKQAKWVNDYQYASTIPLMVSIDGEWGINMRLDSTIRYPRQLTLGAIQDNQLIYKMGKRIAEECKMVGVNINLAPVVDVNNNPDNPVINDRSFGENKYNVALKGLAYMQGMQDQKIMAVGKHFPGHGDTDADSHKTLPVILHDIDRLKDIEFYPFQALFTNGLQGVMAAHLHIPALDNRENRAVSLSKKVTTHLLRDSLGFKGLVFSDALNMKGVSAFFAPGEVDKEAFLAGNDILLFSEDIKKGISLIRKSVSDKEISEDYINTRLAKVLEYKYELGLDKKSFISTKNINSYLVNKEGKDIQKELFEKALTVVVNEENLIPLSQDRNIKVASLSIGKSKVADMFKRLSSYRDITNFTSSNYSLEKLATFDQVIISVYGMSRYSSKNYGFSETELNLIKAINKKTKVILVLFGSPYSLKHFDDFKNILVAYERNDITEHAVTNLLINSIGANGKLPVSAGRFKFGMGENIQASSKLKYTSPEDLYINTIYLKKIDSIMNFAIEDKATPGGQILIAKDGQVFYDKAFGTFDYENNQLVDNSSIYDVASITKVISTTLSIMKLYEEKQIDLDKTVRDYLPEFDTTKVGDVTIRSMLLHQSGLPGWIPFYVRSMKDSVYGNWYQSTPNTDFCIPVAEDMYMCTDSTGIIWDIIGKQDVKDKPKYRYSDIGFYLLKRIIERVSEQQIEDYVDQQFYQPLGLAHTTYLPLKKFDKDRIIPSENDEYFRKQKIQGYVHDMGAAMLGGVSGHAGVFSTAQDLSVILQMLLNKGIYGNTRFFEPETVDYFTTRKLDDNRRGLGFDKPVLERDASGPTSDLCSLDTYGHSGFTGCVMWADPKYDLIYIFLSNRTYPTMNNRKLIKGNVRTNIQDMVYHSIGVDTLMLD